MAAPSTPHGAAAAPEIAVAVPSQDRPARLRRLLDALSEQTVETATFEVVVGHDSTGRKTVELLTTHPLAHEGVLRHVHRPPGHRAPGANRNAAWQLARAPLVAFTDDDCRPPPDWLERALAAARRHPGAIVQGATRPDPEEEALLDARMPHSQWIEPPTPFAETCNIVYPRDVLERFGGFPEARWAEDTELALRARRAGVQYVGDPDVLTHHAVTHMSVLGFLRWTLRWSDLPRVVKAYPEVRDEFHLRIFWKRRHAWLPPAVAGALLARRHPLFALLALPWAYEAAPRWFGGDPKGRAQMIGGLPRQALIDLAEFSLMAWGSLKARTIFL